MKYSVYEHISNVSTRFGNRDMLTTFWFKYKTSIWHREDGPAREYEDGDFVYQQNNMFHRLDGPAYKINGSIKYFLNDQEIQASSDQEFFQYQKLQAFQ